MSKNLVNKFLASFLGIGAVHFLSLEVDILKNWYLLIWANFIFIFIFLVVIGILVIFFIISFCTLFSFYFLLICWYTWRNIQ